ncbi:MAG: hypothetical protein ACREP9_03975, partial [Candidatus Dormibacteraceae bacterium]
QGQVPNPLVQHRGARAQMSLHDLDGPSVQGPHGNHLVRGDLLLQQAKDDAGGADRVVDAEALENLLVAGIVDPCEHTLHVPKHFCHLAYDQVVLILAGHGNHHIGPGEPGLLLYADFTTVAEEYALVAQHARETLSLAWLLLKYENFIVTRLELLRKVHPDISAPDDNEIHALDPELRR